MKKALSFAILAGLAFMITGCSPEVGSEAWCKQMNEKPKGDWTVNEARDYSKYCIFKQND